MKLSVLTSVTGQIILAIALVFSVFVITGMVKQIKTKGTISVKGCAERVIESDIVKWQGKLCANAETQILAYEKLERELEILKQFMESEGIDLQEVYFSPISMSNIYKLNENGNVTNEMESYTLSVDFGLSSNDLPLVTGVSQAITHLIKEGLNVTSYLPEYYFLNIEELKISMLGEASNDALQRAEKLVSNSGSQVGWLRSAHQGVFQITPAFSSSVSDYGEYDTSSISKRIKAVVTMEYGIQ